MIHNPYAKKRPRPSDWISSSSSSSISTSAPVIQQSALDTQIPRRHCGSLDQKENLTSLAGEVHIRSNISNYDRNPNKLEANDHLMNVKSGTWSSAPTADKGTEVFTTMDCSNALQTKQSYHSKKNHAKPSAQDKFRISAERTSIKIKNNPYLKKSDVETSNFLPSAKSPTTTKGAHDLLRKVHSNPYAKLSSGINNKSSHEKHDSKTSIPSSNDASYNETCPLESQTYCSTSGIISNNDSSNKVISKLSSSVASIRPASWKLKNGSLAKHSEPCADPSGRSLTITRQKDEIKSTTNSADENCKQGRTHNTANDRDCLPQELLYNPDEVKPIQDEYRMLLIKNANLSDPLKNGWTLFPHQKKAIIRALTMRRMILALDMGLGKTLIGTVWSKAFKETFGRDKLKVYVICPVSLKEEWKRTAEESVGLKADEEVSGKSKTKNKKSVKRKRTAKNQISSDLSRKDVVETSDTNMDMTICSWAKVPKKVGSNVLHFVVCCDEAHAMQSTQSQRTKDILNLVNDKRCVGVLLLTGTPMKNGKPSNLFPLLKAVRHPLGRNQKAFETHFCNGMLKNFGRGPQWDATGASNLDQLKRKVASNLLHMTKEQCLTELPPMTKISHHVPVSSRYQVQYEHSIKYLASVQANSSNMRDEAVLGAVQRLRVVCAHAKVEATVEMARSVLNKEPAVVIFSYFAQVAKNVHSKLEASGWPCSLLTGETPQNKRQKLVDDFQNGLSSVFVCTFGAGGVGLTLTAASTIILLDRPWTPGETRQAEDRIRRIGQVKSCKSIWITSFDLDRQIDGMLESKRQTTNAVLDKADQKRISGPPSKISINQLVHKFVLSEARKSL